LLGGSAQGSAIALDRPSWQFGAPDQQRDEARLGQTEHRRLRGEHSRVVGRQAHAEFDRAANLATRLGDAVRQRPRAWRRGVPGRAKTAGVVSRVCAAARAASPMPHRSIVTRSRERRDMSTCRCASQWHPTGGVPPILPYALKKPMLLPDAQRATSDRIASERAESVQRPRTKRSDDVPSTGRIRAKSGPFAVSRRAATRCTGAWV
jgi:hypothetical protein